MKRVIVDYKKLTNEILSMLVEKYPDGYGDDDIIRFKNAKNETVEALEVRTEDIIYLVKVSTHLANTMESFDEEEDFSHDEHLHNDSLDISIDKKDVDVKKISGEDINVSEIEEEFGYNDDDEEDYGYGDDYHDDDDDEDEDDDDEK